MKTSIIDPIVITASRIDAIANHYIYEPFGLTTSSGRLLRYIAANGKVSPGEIVRNLGNTKSNVSQRLNFLEKNKLIKRTAGSANDDKRIVFVQATKKGMDLVEKIMATVKDPVEYLENLFTDDEKKAHKAFFEKLNEILTRHEKEMDNFFK